MRALRSRRTSISLTGCEVCEARLYLSAEAVALVSTDQTTDATATQSVDTLSVDGLDAAAIATLQALYNLTGSGQTVVVIDTGIAYDHEALGGGYGAGYTVVGGYDFAENDADPYDDTNGHGTVVAGIIAGQSDTISSLASDVDLVALRVFDDSGHCDIAWVEDALQWVLDNLDTFDNPITTINLSLGVNLTDEMVASMSILDDELAALEADGIFISVAAGNSFTTYGTTGVAYPASSDSVVAVASVDSDGSLSYYSQRDADVVAAPGRSILSCVPDYLGDENGIADDYARYSGTSMAAAYVSAAAVLLRQAYESVGVENVTQDTIYQTMIDTADTVYDSVTGLNYYRLNLTNAIESIMALKTDEAGDTGSTGSTTDGTTDTVQSETGATGSTAADTSTSTSTSTSTGADASADAGANTNTDTSNTAETTPVQDSTSETSGGSVVTTDPTQDSTGTGSSATDSSDTSLAGENPADGSAAEQTAQDSSGTDSAGGSVVTTDPADANTSETGTSTSDNVAQDSTDNVVAPVQGSDGESNVAGDSGTNGPATGTETPPADVAVPARPTYYVVVQRYVVLTSIQDVRVDLGLTSWAPPSLGWTAYSVDVDQANQQAIDSLYCQDWAGGGMRSVDGLDEIAATAPFPSEDAAATDDWSWLAQDDFWLAEQEA